MIGGGSQRRVRLTMPVSIDFQVYVAKPVPCPYLGGREEGKLLVSLDDDDAKERYDLLIEHGFRRSHRWAYRPRCKGCLACWPVRIDVAAFRASRSQRRVLRGVRGLTLECGPPLAQDADLRVLHAYLGDRHRDGVMAAMTDDELRTMIEDSRVETELWRLRDAAGAVVAVMIVDCVAGGVSLVYSGFLPPLGELSVGTAWVLLAIEEASRRGLTHVYLGYLVEGCRKMEYKASFSALEVLDVEGWGPLPRRTAGERRLAGASQRVPEALETAAALSPPPSPKVP